jgi:hypothetical protein
MQLTKTFQQHVSTGAHRNGEVNDLGLPRQIFEKLINKTQNGVPTLRF